jgi:hypothetical protein
MQPFGDAPYLPTFDKERAMPNDPSNPFPHSSQALEDLLQRSTEALQQQRDQLHQHAEQTREQLNTYVREEPVKSLLLAAAAGAVLIGVAALLMRGNSHHHP